MPTAAEHGFLLQVLLWVLLSIPVMLALRWAEQHIFRNTEQEPMATMHRDWKAIDGVFALSMIVLVSLLFMGGGPAEGDGSGDGTPDVTPDLMVMQIFLQLTMVGIVLFYLAIWRKMDVVQIFGLRRLPPWKILATSLLWIIPGIIVISQIVLALKPHLETSLHMEMKEQFLVTETRSGLPLVTLILTGITLCFGAPIMEELLFRGIFYSVGRRFSDPVYAALGSGIFFAVIHQNLFALVPLTLLGIVFAAAYERTRCLWVPICMHALFNSSQFLLLLHGSPSPS